MSKQIPNKKFPYPIGTRISVKSPHIKKLATIVGLSYNSCACMEYEIKFDGEDVVVHYPTDLMTPVNEAPVKNNCAICEIIKNETRIVYNDEYACAITDGFPVSPGHTLIVPKRHVESLFDLTDKELKSMYSLIVAVRNLLDFTCHPDGYNIGINEGRAAGRTVDHAHIHIIPRYNGDVEDPRGGVRGVIPEKQKY